ncbi:MAG: hypothetical protein H6Q52_1282 [Deltaproteobacteria bacterium]|nr:hypothetical protein [Deltaproteobacteria bacterium]
MKKSHLKKSIALIVLLIVFLIAGPALAEKPPWAGGGKDKSNDAYERHESKGGPPDQGHDVGKDDHSGKGKGKNKDKHKDKGKAKEHHKYFSDDKRVVINNYYAGQYKQGKHCPPGLAKKHNGCMPPGQAKKWAVGRPMPRDVIYYDLPPNLVVQLGPPPAHHKYVRVAQDVLLLAVGTGMVVDAIQNLSWEFNH